MKATTPKLTEAQRSVLASADVNGNVEPCGRYRACDALARRGLLVSDNAPRRYSGLRNVSERSDIFAITDAGRVALKGEGT